MSVRVKISEADKCIYENNNCLAPGANNLCDLISCLKDTQVEINDFLTSLVERQSSSAKSENQATSDTDSDFEDEVEVIPKKSKLAE